MVIYREAFIRSDLGSAAAISVALLAVLSSSTSSSCGVLRRRSTDRRPTMIRTRIALPVGLPRTGTALAILFLSPLLWSGYVARGRTGTGFGLENYDRLFTYGNGIRVYTGQQRPVAR